MVLESIPHGQRGIVFFEQNYNNTCIRQTSCLADSLTKGNRADRHFGAS